MRRLRLGRPRSALIVAPHADDEAIGAYGLIAALRRRGCRVRVLVVTDGAGSHRRSRRWPTARLVAERRRETRRVMRALDVPAGQIGFLALPDGGLGHDPGDEARVRAALRPRPDLLVGPVAGDAHPDHRFVAAALAGARLAGTRRLGYLVWPGGRAATGPMSRLPLGRRRSAKRAAVRRYRTQMGVIRDDPAGFAIAPHELRAFTRPCEFFREER